MKKIMEQQVLDMTSPQSKPALLINIKRALLLLAKKIDEMEKERE